MKNRHILSLLLDLFLTFFGLFVFLDLFHSFSSLPLFLSVVECLLSKKYEWLILRYFSDFSHLSGERFLERKIHISLC